MSAMAARSCAPFVASPHVPRTTPRAVANTPCWSKATAFQLSNTRGRRLKSAELEEVDPMTGEIISGTSLAAAAPLSIEAGGFTWAYRTADVNPANASPDKLPVLCLHSIGSNSYAFRNTLRLLGAAGHPAFAIDWLGHGGSSKPVSGAFPYTADAYIAALREAVQALPIDKPFALVTHGYILGQFGLLFAAQNPDLVAKLVIINNPLGLKSPLRPELAAYKSPLPFMRPKAGATFDAAYFNAGGSPYAMQRKDADAYAAPYEADPAASAAIAAIMTTVDFQALLRRVDEEFMTWRNPSLVIHGGSDSFIDLKQALDWLESKRTSMKMATGIEAKLGHNPNEDYPEAIVPAITKFLNDT